MALLEAANLHAAYGLTRVLHGMSFGMEKGTITTLLGANGAGKTTTLRAICNMVRSTGAIEFEGQPLASRSMTAARKFAWRSRRQPFQRRARVC